MNASTFYHIYNHANGSENLFRQEKNYPFFLQKFASHISPIADTYSYCLMPNHLHFLIRIKEEFELLEYFKKKASSVLCSSDIFKYQNISERMISQPFSNLFNSYTKSYNKSYNRRGSLFVPNFKKKEIISDSYLTNIIYYIHANPVKHGFVRKLEDWPHSSYHSFLSEKSTALKRLEVLDWFGGGNGFIDFHRQTFNSKILSNMDF